MTEALAILRDLKAKNYKPVYFLCGDEPYYIDLISDYIEENVLDEGERSFNQTILYGRDVDGGTIAGEAKRYPMMSEHTVVIIKEAQHIKKIEDLAGYLQAPLESTLLVLCYKYKTPDGRTDFGKKVKKLATYLETKKLYDNKLPEWITAYASNHKLRTHPQAAVMMAEFLGNDLSKIANEINKLAINLPAGSEILASHVQENIGVSKDYNVFELQTALGQKDVLKCNKIANYFGKPGSDAPPQMIIPSLYGYFIKVMLMHKLTDKTQAAKVLGVHPFFVKEYEIASRLYNPMKLVNVISTLREYDMKSKGINGTIDNAALYKEMIFKILH
ncbi:MAG: DNA polymerase III subunit delta [Bacteroidia bacterium]|nr:DNA polymerase III subunit delta [Bacteroidia bacterium]